MALKVSSIPALPRVNSGIGRLLPVVTMITAALLMVLPVRIPGYASLTPALTLMVAYHWTIYRPDLLSPVALFAIGLAEDLVAGGPVGVSPLALLLARAGVLKYRRLFVNRGFPFVWTGFTILAGLVMFALWALHCLLDLNLLDLRNTLFRMVLTIAAFPAASFLLGRAQRTLIGPG